MSTVERDAVFQVSLAGVPLRQEDVSRIEQAVRKAVLVELAGLDALSSTTIEPLVVQPSALISNNIRTQGITVRNNLSRLALERSLVRDFQVEQDEKSRLTNLAGEATKRLSEMAQIIANKVGSSTSFVSFSLRPATESTPLQFDYSTDESGGDSSALIVHQVYHYFDPPGICR